MNAQLVNQGTGCLWIALAKAAKCQQGKVTLAHINLLVKLIFCSCLIGFCSQLYKVEENGTAKRDALGKALLHLISKSYNNVPGKYLISLAVYSSIIYPAASFDVPNKEVDGKY